MAATSASPPAMHAVAVAATVPAEVPVAGSVAGRVVVGAESVVVGAASVVVGAASMFVVTTCWGVTVTVNVPVATLPARTCWGRASPKNPSGALPPSVAVQVMEVSPSGNIEPDAGVH